MPEQYAGFSRSVVLHLEARGWSLGQCCHCGASFLVCSPRGWCGQARCIRSGSGVVEPSRRPRFPEEVWRAVHAHFARAQFTTTNRRDIANPAHRDTRFVGAGLQVFEEGIERGAAPPAMALFVPQPVIRLNYWAAVGVSTATSTSFVNLCTEHARSSLTEFLRHLGLWVDLLEDLRIRPKDMTIILAADRWRGGPFAGPSLSVEVNGLEIGDAILIDEGGSDAAAYLPITDFSFGLERIVAAVNPGLQYSLFLGPLPESVLPDNERVIDRIRTATLMCMMGVIPSSRGHGRHLRRAVSDAMLQHSTIDFAAAISHAYRYWSQFITPLRELHECQWTLESERAHARAIEVIRMCRGRNRSSDVSAASADEACRRFIAAEGHLGSITRCATLFSHGFRNARPDSAPVRT